MNISSVNLNLLVALDALLRERSVTRAAQRTGVTQAAMSNSLSNLRELFDDVLFTRKPHGMEPTVRALQLAPAVHQGLAMLGSALSRSEFDPLASERRFILATNDYCEQVVLPPLLTHLARAAPGVRLEVRHSVLQEIPTALERGEIDLAIGFYRDVPGGYFKELLFEEHMVCLLRKGHPKVKSRLTLKRYVALDHIVVSQISGVPTFVDLALERLGHTRRISLRMSNSLAVPFVVAQTDLVAAVSERLARAIGTALPLRILPLPLELGASRISQAWHARTDGEAGHRWLRDTIKEVCQSV
jgi:DNA-binding transcriptional LysR family regulator